MKGKSLLVIAAMVGFFLFPGLAVAEGRIWKRQERQYRRIEQGIRTGEITKKEERRLLREQEHIGKAKRRALRDCYLSPRERIRLERMLDKSSRNIYRARHNRIYRRPWPHVSRFVYPRRPWPEIPPRHRSGSGFYFKMSVFEPGWGFSWFVRDP